MKFTEEQKDLLAILPQDLQNSKELTDSAKLVLADIIFLYGMEYAQNNGYVYRTNIKMMEETGIKSEHTLIMAIRNLEFLGFVETKRGKRKEASTYKLIKNCSNEIKNCSNNLEKCSNNCSNNLQNCSNEIKNCSNNLEKCSNNCSNNLQNCSNEIETLQNQILLLQKQIVLLQKEVENLKNCSNNSQNCSNNCSNEIEKCSTDTDIDKEIDKDKDINNTCIHEHDDLETKVTKKENIIKEKVNEMKNAVLNEMEREVEKDNKNITSTYGDNNTNSNLKIDDKTGCNNSTVMEDDELFNKVFGLSSTETQNKGACDVENTSIDNLSTSTEKTQQEGLKTQNNAYSLQEWMTEYNKLILQVENTDVEDDSFNSILDEGAKLFESFPKNEGNYRSAMQDLRYWVVRKLDFNKTFKISERWNRYYRIA